MEIRFKNKVKRDVEQQVSWYDAKTDIPNDKRDVLALLSKPVWGEASKKFILMPSMDVIHIEKKVWYLNGREIKPINFVQAVLCWCEVPDGWQKFQGSEKEDWSF